MRYSDEPDVGDICGECKQFDAEALACDVFPAGVPEDILRKRRISKEVDDGTARTDARD